MTKKRKFDFDNEKYLQSYKKELLLNKKKLKYLIEVQTRMFNPPIVDNPSASDALEIKALNAFKKKIQRDMDVILDLTERHLIMESRSIEASIKTSKIGIKLDEIRNNTGGIK